MKISFIKMSVVLRKPVDIYSNVCSCGFKIICLTETRVINFLKIFFFRELYILYCADRLYNTNLDGERQLAAILDTINVYGLKYL
jgi:hypothetical protein